MITNDGWFDDDKTGMYHFSFKRATLCGIFKGAGFCNARDVTAVEVEKPIKTLRAQFFSTPWSSLTKS